MFNQFRLHYPKGSLVTELSAIDHGKYIVRCLVQVEGTTLVTALAAAQTVELAEDQARSRALAVLGILPTTATEEQETPIANREVRVVPQPPLPTPIVPPAFSSESLYDTQATRFSEPSMVGDTNSFSSLNSKLEEVAERAVTTSLVADEITLPDDAFTAGSTSQEMESSDWVTERKSSSTQLKEPTVKSSARSKVKLEEDASQVTPPDTPVDFSDIIARTNVELKRLGWTTQQGKDYLLQTYGKRSRQLLSDAELLDFLHHLEAQPTPDD
jgi:hypothetical protein